MTTKRQSSSVLQNTDKKPMIQKQQDCKRLSARVSNQVVIIKVVQQIFGQCPREGKIRAQKIIQRRAVRVEDNKDADYRAASEFMTNAPEAILYEIFVRLPDCRSSIYCGSVCRRWHSAISNPQFLPSFLRHQDCNLRPYSTIFRRALHPYKTPAFLILRSKQSIFLNKNFYMDFRFMSPFMIWASLDDLLLVSNNASHLGHFFIFNPVTKQQRSLPKCPNSFRIGWACGFAIVRDKLDQYKIVFIFTPRPEGVDGSPWNFKVQTLCCRSGEWRETRFRYPQPKKLTGDLWQSLIPCNDILYWRETQATFDRVIALDLFNSHCYTIDFPDDFVSGWKNSYGKVCLGVVCKRLRLLQVFKTHKKCFIIKVWELRCKDDIGSPPSSWVLVCKRVITRPNTAKLVHVYFHPINGDIVYMIWGRYCFQYIISKDVYLQIVELSISIDPNEQILSFPLVHPPWPTPIPLS